MISRMIPYVWCDSAVPQMGFPADESYSPVFMVGGVWAGAVCGGGAGRRRRGRGFGAGAGCAAGAGAAACRAFKRSAASRLTLATVVAGGPTGGVILLPTLILSASGLPVLSIGAAALGGTA